MTDAQHCRDEGWAARHAIKCLGRMLQAIDVEIDGRVEACYLCVVEAELNAEQLRSAALATFTPIHSYMFSNTGELLYATHNASLKLKAAGGSRLPQAALGLESKWEGRV